MTASIGQRDNPAPRQAARVLLVDAANCVLLFRGIDPGRPGETYWFTVGGGLDHGESPQQAAARELREETGLEVAAADVGLPVWREVTDFPFDSVWYRQQQDYFLYRVPAWEVSTAGHDVIERASIVEHRWWSVEELMHTDERYYPLRLPDLLREILGL
jgi:8-oxo-dGTP pyrophosphatase MutT (NUDIX family)